MRRLASWAARVGTGFVRAGEVAVTSMIVPAGWAATALAVLWFGLSPWASLAPVVFACLGTLALAGPVARRFRSFAARWTGVDVPAGYRWLGPVVQLSTGYWWNGFSYERTREDALADQRMRGRWRDSAFWRDVRFTAIAPLTAGLVAAVPVAGAAGAVLAFTQPEPSRWLLGAGALAVAVVTAPYAWRAAAPMAVRFLSSPQAELAERVEELTAQRADTTVAQAAEIRRIERDLHDGAQARLVALGLSLATAEKLMETDPAGAKELMREARAGASSSLSELRELVKGISPPVLTERGLVDAVRALALDSPLEVAVEADLRTRLDPPVESAVYFGIAELMTNAAKHAGAKRVRIAIASERSGLAVSVEDDGRGGAAEREGGGLAGLRRRLAVFDGSLEVASPAGGPTCARMRVPCESS
jgi:signal transduction histidine kinase